jgi:nitrate/nitrite transporter NarK
MLRALEAPDQIVVSPDDNKVRKKLGIKRTEQARSTPWHMLQGNTDFRWHFFGSVSSDFGTWLQNSAQVLLAYQLSHSVLTVGLVTFAQFSSPLVLGPWVGVLADRLGGRRTLLITQVVSAMVAATLACLDLRHGCLGDRLGRQQAIRIFA